MSGASSAGGKQARAGSRPVGSPSTTKQNTRSPRPEARNAAASAFTQRERAAAGEQITTSAAESASAAVMVLPRSPAVGSSSRSRNTGPRRAGTGPWRPAVPTRRFGTR